MPDLPAANEQVIPALRPLHLAGAADLLEKVVTTILVGRDQAYLNQPWVSARTIRIDTSDAGVLDFDLSHADKRRSTKGVTAAEDFLSTWNWSDYVTRFR